MVSPLALVNDAARDFEVALRQPDLNRVGLGVFSLQIDSAPIFALLGESGLLVDCHGISVSSGWRKSSAPLFFAGALGVYESWRPS